MQITIPRNLSPGNVPKGQTLEETLAASRRAEKVRDRLEATADRLIRADEKPGDTAPGLGQVKVEGLTYRWLKLEGEAGYQPESGEVNRLTGRHGEDRLSISSNEEERSYSLVTPKKQFDLVENLTTGTLTLTET